ncbi:MAG: exopolysaccharide transport family protein [Methylocystis sp.]
MRAGERYGEESGVTGEIDLSRIARAVSARRWWVIGPTLAMLAGSLIFVNTVNPRFSSEARVLLENQESFIPRAEKTDRVSEILPDPEAVQSQIQLLTSRDLARRVIKTLELQGNDEFDPLAKGMGAATRTLVMLGLARDPTLTSPEDRILEAFADKLSVLSPTKTRVLSIEFTSRNPDLAAKGANAVADAYLQFQQDAKRERARDAANSLAALVAQLRARVTEADAQAEEFRMKSGLLVGSNNTTINAQHLGDLNTQLSLSRSAQADAQAKARLLREMLRQNRISDIPDVANNEVIRRLLEQRVTLRAQLALELRTLLPGHPRIKELQAQLQDLDAQGRAAAERIVRTLENEASIAGARVENLTKALEAQKSVVGASDADNVRLRDLERTARLYKEQLEGATAKYQEALARENSRATPADARIFQRALAPQIPSFPKKVPIVSFATLSALILSIGAVLSVELLSGRPRVAASAHGSRDENAREASPARVSVVPALLTENNMIHSSPEPLPQSPEWPETEAQPPGDERAVAGKSEIVEKIDTGRLSSPSVRVLIFRGDSSAIASATVLAVARALARRGSAVLVATDAGDTAYNGLLVNRGEAPKGWRDLLSGAAEFGEVIYRDGESRLQIIPAGEDEPALQHEPAMVVEALAQTYDFVVFTTMSAADALRLGPMFDTILLRDADPAARELLEEFSRSRADVSLIEDAAEDLVAA